MTYHLKNSASGCMCLDETRNCIFSASGKVRKILFPECKSASEVCKLRQAYINLSSDGKYLSVYAPGNNALMVFDTANLQKPIFEKKWKNAVHASNKCCFFGNDVLLVPVQNYLYAIDLVKKTTCVVYGNSLGKPSGTNWINEGHIFSLDVRGDEVVMIYYSFNPSETSLLYSKGKDIVFKKEVLHAPLHKYIEAAFHPNGGVCLFSDISRTMLFFNSCENGFFAPDDEIVFPYTPFWPRFSNNGKYFTFAWQSPSVSGYCLVNAKDWTLLKSVEGPLVCNPSFSTNDTYWLLPGEKPTIIDLLDIQNESGGQFRSSEKAL